MSRPLPSFAKRSARMATHANANANDDANAVTNDAKEADTSSHADGSARLEPPTQQLQPQPAHRGCIAQSCHADALHCIFAFLSTKEWLSALHSCRSWYAAGAKGPSRALRLNIRAVVLERVGASPLRSHVAEVIVHQVEDTANVVQLQVLATLPRLAAANIHIHGGDLERHLQQQVQQAAQQQEQQAQQEQDATDTDTDAAPTRRQLRAAAMRALLPPSLRTFAVRFLNGENPMQALIDTLGTLPQLRSVRFHTTHKCDLAPFVSLAHLDHLELRDPPTMAQCTSIKQMGALTDLRVFFPYWDKAALNHMLTPPFALQRLQGFSMGMYQTIDRPLMDGLLRLPSLTALQPASIQPDCWADLGSLGLSKLRALKVAYRAFTPEQLASLEGSLRVLTCLTDLDLDLVCTLRPDTLRMPQLRLLRLEYVSMRRADLDFLAHTPLLESVQLVRCNYMNAADLVACLRAHPPQHLASLCLKHCGGLDGYLERTLLQGALRPPSALLPSLTTFDLIDLSVEEEFWDRS